eukprot:1141533-Pelagomonas_calceolata.AAC.4
MGAVVGILNRRWASLEDREGKERKGSCRPKQAARRMGPSSLGTWSSSSLWPTARACVMLGVGTGVSMPLLGV